jgi:chorismate mutase
MSNYKDIRNQINTGDIVLFSCRDNLVSIGIQLMTQSKWSHVGMVLKDYKKDIIYLWESTTLSNIKDAIDNIPKKGVQLVLLSERIKYYNGEIAIRHLQGIKIDDDSKEMQTLMKLREELKDKPFEQNKFELIRAAIDKFGSICKNKEDLSSVFCAELVAEAYQCMGLLDESEPSNEYVPKDFSEEGSLKLLKGAYLGPEIMIEKPIILPEQDVVSVAA